MLPKCHNHQDRESLGACSRCGGFFCSECLKDDEKGEIIKDEQGEPVVDTEIPEIIDAFNEFKRKHSLRF